MMSQDRPFVIVFFFALFLPVRLHQNTLDMMDRFSTEMTELCLTVHVYVL